MIPLSGQLGTAQLGFDQLGQFQQSQSNPLPTKLIIIAQNLAILKFAALVSED